MSGFWDIFGVISGAVSDLTTISSGVNKIGDSLSSQIPLSSSSQISATFGGVTDAEFSASLSSSGSTSKYGEIYDPSIDAMRPQTLDEALSSVNQSIANAPASAPQSYIDSLKGQQYDLINDKLAAVSYVALPNVADLVPKIDYPIVQVPAINIPDFSIGTATDISLPSSEPINVVGAGNGDIAESKMKPMEPSEPIKDVNPSTLYGETHTDFAPSEEIIYTASGGDSMVERSSDVEEPAQIPVTQTPPAQETPPTG